MSRSHRSMLGQPLNLLVPLSLAVGVLVSSAASRTPWLFVSISVPRSVRHGLARIILSRGDSMGEILLLRPFATANLQTIG